MVSFPPAIQCWETNRVPPALRFTARIVEFLGYDPLEKGARQSVSEMLKAYRRRLGPSRNWLAALVRIDESSLAGWEIGRHVPGAKSLEIICKVLAAAASPAEELEE